MYLVILGVDQSETRNTHMTGVNGLYQVLICHPYDKCERVVLGADPVKDPSDGLYWVLTPFT